jgi:hypothetical protein
MSAVVPIQITAFAKAGGALTKRISLAPDGTLIPIRLNIDTCPVPVPD